MPGVRLAAVTDIFPFSSDESRIAIQIAGWVPDPAAGPSRMRSDGSASDRNQAHERLHAMAVRLRVITSGKRPIRMKFEGLPNT